MAKRRYRMTPARRAALKKAQAASARKRRKRAVISGAKTVGAVAGSIATSALIYHANKYAQNPGLAVAHGKAAKGYASKKFGKGPRVDPNAPGKQITYIETFALLRNWQGKTCQPTSRRYANS
jgi:hypothetical protein